MSVAKMIAANCDGLDGRAREFRDGPCEDAGRGDPFESMREALDCLRGLGWLVGRPDDFGARPALCPTCRRALAAAIRAGAVKLDSDDRLLAGGRP